MSNHPTHDDCIFCKIVAGQIPCHRIHETETMLAFLDVGPLSRGHMLLIPKGHWPTMDELPDAIAGELGGALPRLSRALRKAVDADAWNVLQNNGQIAGQAVFHLHYHLIPRAAGDDLGFRWPAGSLDGDDASTLVDAITGALADDPN